MLSKLIASIKALWAKITGKEPPDKSDGDLYPLW